MENIYENILDIDFADDNYISNSTTGQFFNEALNRIKELEELKTKTDEETYTRERHFFATWFYLVLDRVIDYAFIDYYKIHRSEIDNMIQYYRESIAEDDVIQRTTIIEKFYKIFNVTGHYAYFEDENNIPYIEIYENIIFNSDLNDENELINISLKHTGNKLIIKKSTLKSTFNLASLVQPMDTYVALSDKRICRVMNKYYGAQTGKQLFVLDAKNSPSISIENVIAIYKKVDNIYNSGKSAIIEAYRKGE